MKTTPVLYRATREEAMPPCQCSSPATPQSRRTSRSCVSSSVLFLVSLLVLVAAARAEYTWNGHDWVWNEESPDKSSSNAGGSSVSRTGGNAGDVDGDGGSGDGGDWDDADGDGAEEGSGNDYEETVVEQYNPNNYNTNANSNNNYNANEDDFRVDEDTDDSQDEDIYLEGNNSNGYYTTSPPRLYPTEPPPRDRHPHRPASATSFFAQPGTLAAVVGGAVVGLLCAILCVMFVVYRMRKKDEGSYALDEPKRIHPAGVGGNNAYGKAPSREFYA